MMLPGVCVQVWFPDSADKTAQAIEEFEREGLPLFILANWRGFAGGQRDLFDGVLQVGMANRTPQQALLLKSAEAVASFDEGGAAWPRHPPTHPYFRLA
jgi:hypothetical protein